MEWLFGKKKTPKEILRENQRALKKAIRELDRERTTMQANQTKIIADMKKAAKDGQMAAAKIMAKDLVRTRKYVTKFYAMRTQLQAVSLRIQTLTSNQAMAEAMVGVTKAMRSMNAQLNLPQIQAIMMEFERQSEMMDMKDEMFNDAIDDAMDDADDEEEEDRIVAEVFEEIGINFGDSMAQVPVGGAQAVAAPAAAAPQPVAVGAGADDELESRLQNLRR
eukprot:c48384_g1_i1.p1 GENE.c48384_g1_i1~~c48384_g1_i1.p1  ORF type:complete len:237 (+),score=64.84 c48384_g1_i1:51-713(+)